MGDDPRDAVTDGGGRVRGVEGLYVADTALLPGPAGVPLGSTVAALARHVAVTVIADLGGAGGGTTMS
jgi:cholesterol oxidase